MLASKHTIGIQLKSFSVQLSYIKAQYNVFYLSSPLQNVNVSFPLHTGIHPKGKTNVRYRDVTKYFQIKFYEEMKSKNKMGLYERMSYVLLQIEIENN